MRLNKFVVVLCFFVPFAAMAQNPQPVPQDQQPVPMVIEPADADALREIIESTIPPKYNGALIRWYTAIVQRQLARQAAEKARDKQ